MQTAVYSDLLFPFLSFQSGQARLLFSCLVVSDCLRPHGLQPAWLLCPMEFFRQGYWSGLLFPSSGDLLDLGLELMSPALASGFTGSSGKPGQVRSRWQLMWIQRRGTSGTYLSYGALSTCAGLGGPSVEGCITEDLMAMPSSLASRESHGDWSKLALPVLCGAGHQSWFVRTASASSGALHWLQKPQTTLHESMIASLGQLLGVFEIFFAFGRYSQFYLPGPFPSPSFSCVGCWPFSFLFMAHCQSHPMLAPTSHHVDATGSSTSIPASLLSYLPVSPVVY